MVHYGALTVCGGPTVLSYIGLYRSYRCSSGVSALWYRSYRCSTSLEVFAIGCLSVCLVGMAAMSVGGQYIGSYSVTTCKNSYHTCNDSLEWLSCLVVCLLLLMTCG
jgi:hypothetical protein